MLSMPRIVPEAGEPVFVPEPKAVPGAAAPIADAAAPVEAASESSAEAPVAEASSPAVEAGGETQPEQA